MTTKRQTRAARPERPASVDDLTAYPGHLFRRAQQIITLRWSAEVSADITAAQFSLLNALRQAPNIDQRTLGQYVSMDRSTVAEILGRLTARGLIGHTRHPVDRRRKVLAVTPAGARLAAAIEPKAQAMSRRLLGIFSAAEASEFHRLLVAFIGAWENDGTGSEPDAGLSRRRVSRASASTSRSPARAATRSGCVPPPG